MLLGARQFFEQKKGSALPYDAEVEYLGSQGTEATLGPYILSQYDIVAGNIFEIEVSFPAALTGSTVVIGRNAGNWECFYRFNGSGYFGGGSFNTGTSFIAGARYKTRFDLTSGAMSLTVNGAVVKTSTGVQTNRKKFPLFVVATGAQNILNSNVPIYIHRFRAWSASALVEDFIPVRFTNEQNQSEGAMYDRVSGQLFRNAGTGAFLYGPDKS